jgi:transcriptional regulator with XRE-family HTH domain
MKGFDLMVRRKRAKVTQEEVAKRLGLSRGRISQMEAEARLDPQDAERLTKALDEVVAARGGE